MGMDDSKVDDGKVDEEIVIVGGGICGLATALALHRKGIRSVVLERSKSLRASGSGIGILPNGWRALDQLGVASILRQTAIPIQATRDLWLDKGKQRETPFTEGEARCLKRSDLINALANDLPYGTIHFGCHIVSVKLDPQTNYPILQRQDGSSIITKVLIGCDGANSVIADFLELKPTKKFNISVARGLTNYPTGHAFLHEFVRMKKDNTLVGRIPIDDKLVYWYVAQQWTRIDPNISHDPEFIRQSTLDSLNDFPSEITKMIKYADQDSLVFTHLRYRAPWDLLLGRFRKGTITVAGDAMHVMGPFLRQGGSASLEDAVVLARNLAKKVREVDLNSSGKRQIMAREVEKALDQYLTSRRMRVVRLSSQTYLTGVLMGSPSMILKFTCIILMVILFRNPTSHTTYDCGTL